MTFLELKIAIAKLTDEQLAERVHWVGDDCGGELDSLGFAEEDTIRDDGDSGELFTRSDFEESCREYGGPERLENGVVVGKKGTPLLFTDGVR